MALATADMVAGGVTACVLGETITVAPAKTVDSKMPPTAQIITIMMALHKKRRLFFLFGRRGGSLVKSSSY